MKFRLFKLFSFAIITTFLFNTFLQAQTTTSTSSGRSGGTTAEVEKAEAQVRRVTDDAGKSFKQALFYLQDNRRDKAREDFDKSVEFFLLSGIDVQRNQNLSDCYNQLIETIYRIEFPSERQQPNIRSLSATCRWEIKNELADDIAKSVLATTNETTDGNNPTEQSQAGFSDQTFEPALGDELAKLELNQEEVNVDTPEAKQEFEYIRVVVANNSLGFSFQMNPLVQQYLNHFRGRGRKTMEVGLYRSGMFMRMARKIFREEGVPENIAWLGQVESAWKPTAQSWAAAAGLWQFIPGTGARYGLRRTAHLDERQSFEKATRASARYLKFLADRYNGNWELGMAAYNCGEGNVDRAIRRAGRSDYWAAYPYLPQETRNYVPMILATILVANNPNQYGFGHIRPAAPLQYDQIRIPPSTSLSLIAKASDTSVEYLRYLNPELRTNSTPPEPYIVRVPAGRADNVVAIFRRLPSNGSRDDSTLASTNRGETWQNISNRTGISVEQLMAANPGMKVPQGKVIVPMNGVERTNYSRPTSQLSTATGSNVKVVRAQSGDTVATLAKRNGANPVEVAKFNGLLVNSKLGAGREIRIPTK